MGLLVGSNRDNSSAARSLYEISRWRTLFSCRRSVAAARCRISGGRPPRRLLRRPPRREAGTDPKAQVELAYRLAAGRPPTERETQLAIEYLNTQPLREFALAVFNLNAFLYVN